MKQTYTRKSKIIAFVCAFAMIVGCFSAMGSPLNNVKAAEQKKWEIITSDITKTIAADATTSVWAKSDFSHTVDSNLSLSDLEIAIELTVDETAIEGMKLAAEGAVELTNSGNCDNSEISWRDYYLRNDIFSELKAGTNTLHLLLDEANGATIGSTGDFSLSNAINYCRFYIVNTADGNFAYDITIHSVTLQTRVADAVSFEDIKGDNSSNTFVTTDLSLPSKIDSESVTWTSNNTDVITNTGVVTRPAYGTGNVAVTLSATMGSEIFDIGVIVPQVGAEEEQILYVENSDFEEDAEDEAPGWALLSGEIYKSGDLDVTQHTSFEGTGSMKLYASNRLETAYATGSLGIRSGYTYTASVMTKGALTPTVTLRFFDMYNQECASFGYTGEVTDAWQMISVSATAPSGAVFVRVMIGGEGFGNLYADDVVLSELPLLPNREFTYGTARWTAADGVLTSDDVVAEDGLAYVLLGKGEADGKMQLLFTNEDGEILETYSVDGTADDTAVIRAFAPLETSTMKVVATKDAFSEFQLYPAATGTQTADGSFESFAAGTGTEWTGPEEDATCEVPDGDFEDDDVNWVLNNGADGKVTFSETTEDYYTGTRSLKLVSETTIGGGAMSPLWEGAAGTTYTLNGNYKTNSGRLRIYFAFWTEDGFDVAANNRCGVVTKDLSNASEWTAFSVTATAPTTAKYISITFYHLAGSSSDTVTSYLDNVVVTQAVTTESAFSASDVLIADGEAGIMLKNTTATSGLIPVHEGKEYAAVVKAKSETAGGAKLSVTYYNRSNEVIETDSVTTTAADTEEWLRVDTTAESVSAHAFNARITLESTDGTAYFDGADFYALSDTVSNASFEDVSDYGKPGNFPTQWRAEGNVVASAVSDTNLGLPNETMALEVLGIEDGSVKSSMIRIEEGTAYTARIYASSTVGGGIKIQFYDKDFTLLSSGTETTFKGSTWNKYNANATAPDTAVYAAISLTAEAGEFFWADAAEFSEAVLDISNDPQLFIDDYVIANKSGLTRTFHEGTKTEPVTGLWENQDWTNEGAYPYGSVLYDEDEKIYKMWYAGYTSLGDDLSDANAVVSCYATSVDGVNWECPNLGLVEFNGSTDNNIINAINIVDDETYFHIASVTKDYDETDENKRYKMTTYLHDSQYSVLYSPDGINWSKPQKIVTGYDVITSAYDSTNDSYLSVLKLEHSATVKRRQFTLSSKDMVTWTDPVASNSLAGNAYALEHYRADSYGMGLYERGGAYIGFNWMLMIPGIHSQEGPMDTRLVYSRDLSEEWQVPTTKAIIPLGEEGTFDDGMVSTAAYAINVGDEVWMYCSAWDGDHGVYERKCDTFITKWRLDGFASLDATADGEMLTRPFTFEGKELRVNADASEGTMYVELLDADGNVLDGYAKEDCDPITGDDVAHAVSWNGSYDVSELAGETITMRIYSEESALYSFQFVDEITETDNSEATVQLKEKTVQWDVLSAEKEASLIEGKTSEVCKDASFSHNLGDDLTMKELELVVEVTLDETSLTALQAETRSIIELNNYGSADSDEIYWNTLNYVTELEAGTVEIHLPFEDAYYNTSDTSGTCFGLNKNIQFFRWYIESAQTTYTFTVNDAYIQLKDHYLHFGDDDLYLKSAAVVSDTENVNTVEAAVRLDDKPTQWAITENDVKHIGISEGGAVRPYTTTGTADGTDYLAEGTGYMQINNTSGATISGGLFQKKMAEAINIPEKWGYEKADLMLTLKMYIEDINTVSNFGELELTSGGTYDQAELSWNMNKQGMTSGWNDVKLTFSSATSYNGSNGVAFDSLAVNYFRWHTMSLLDGALVKIADMKVEAIEADGLSEATIQTPALSAGDRVICESDTLQLLVTKAGNPSVVWDTKQIVFSEKLEENKWTSIAVVRKTSSEEFILYIDGNEAERVTISDTTNITPDTICYIGTTSENVYPFIGEIAYVRLWKNARSATKIGANSTNIGLLREGTLQDTTGNLLGGWLLRGDNDYTIQDYENLGITKNSLIFCSTVATEQKADWFDYESPEFCDNQETDDSFTLVVIPEIKQMVSQNRYMSYWENQVATWIAENIETENIVHVAGLGDLVANSSDALQTRTVNAGYAKFSEQVSYSDASGDNASYNFKVNGISYMILQLQEAPDTDALAWAKELLVENKTANVILTTNAYMDETGAYITDPDIWDEIVYPYSNVKMVICNYDAYAEESAEENTNTYRYDLNAAGNVVPQFMFNGEQFDTADNGYFADMPAGMLGLLRFSADGTQVSLNYYSPIHDKSFLSNKNITLSVEISEYDALSGCEYSVTNDAVVVEYSATDFGNIRSAGVIPTKTGYLFAGWFADEACSSAIGTDTVTSDTVVYAKFVEKELLGVKAQLPVTTYATSETTSMRFATTVDSLDYKEVGFYITIKDGVYNKTKKLSSKTVYNSLCALSTDEGETINTKWSAWQIFSAHSVYFTPKVITNIPNSAFSVDMEVTPYWITLDGTEVTGEMVIKCVNDGLTK